MELRRRMKNVMALFLVAVMVISVVPASTLVVQADSGNPIELGTVSWGTSGSDTTFQFKSPSVELTEGQTILCVSIDNDGYFTASTTMLEDVDVSAVDIGNKYVETIASTGHYIAITVVAKTGGSLTADTIKKFIQGLTFYRNNASNDTEQEVSVATSTVSLDGDMTAMVIDGEIHYYKQVLYGDNDTTSNWYGAYNAAKNTRFNGLRGYLTTITSAAEQYYVYGSLAAKSNSDPQLWIGGARTLKDATDDKGNIKFKFDADSIVTGALTPVKDGDIITSWYWVCGPESGTHFYTSAASEWTSGGQTVDGFYVGWKDGEPNNSCTDKTLDTVYGQEYALEYGYDAANWNDYSPYRVDRSDGWGIRGYLIEFSPYTTSSGESSIVDENAYVKAAAVLESVSLKGPQITANNFTVTEKDVTNYTASGALNDSTTASAIKKAAGVYATANGEDKKDDVKVTTFASGSVNGVYDVTFQLTTTTSSDDSDETIEKTIVKTVKAIRKDVINSGTGTDGKDVSVAANDIKVKVSDIQEKSVDELKALLLEKGAPVAVAGDEVLNSSKITVKKTSIPENTDERTSGLYSVTFTYDGVDVTVDVYVDENDVAPPRVDAHDIIISTDKIADSKTTDKTLSSLKTTLIERAEATYTGKDNNTSSDNVKLEDIAGESAEKAVAAMTTAGELDITFGNTAGENATKTVKVTVVDNYTAVDASGIEIGANDFCITLKQANAVVTNQTEQISEMLKELANATAIKSGYNVATEDISVDASRIKAANGVYPVVFTYKDASVTAYVTVKDGGAIDDTDDITSVQDINLTANDFAIAAKSGTVDEETFVKLANVTANKKDGTPVTVTVNADNLAALNNAIAAGKGEAEVEVYVDDTTKTKVHVSITDTTSVAQSSTPNDVTGAKVTIAANNFEIGTADQLTADTVKKLSNAQAYKTETKEDLSIDEVDLSQVKISTPGTYPVVLKINGTDDVSATQATIYVTVNGDYQTVGDVDKAADANKTSSTVNQNTAVKTTTGSSGDGSQGTLGTGAGTGTVTETGSTIVDETGLIPIKDIQDALGVSAETAAKIQEMAKQYNVSLDTLKITDESIAAQKNDNDMKGTSFGRLKARAIKCKNKQFKLEWTKTSGADGYMIYGNRCNSNGKKYKYKYVKTVGKNTTSMKVKKLEKGTYYKYLVRAYKLIDGKKVTIATSVTVHATTTGGKWGIAKAVKLKKIGSKKVSSTKSAKYTMKVGKKVKISAKEVKQTSKTIRHHRDICYESSDTSVATVNKKGQITAKGKGKCQIWVYAQNGVYSTINLTVK